MKYLRNLVVRNPRNLERLGFQRKSVGYQFEDDRRLKSYIYRAEFLTSPKHVEGVVRHFKNGIVVSASTQEWAIAKHLYSTQDTCAAMNIGRILAHRCLRYGINFVFVGVEKEEMDRSDHIKSFYKSLEEEGLMLEEPEPIAHNYQVDPEFTWSRYISHADSKST